MSESTSKAMGENRRFSPSSSTFLPARTGQWSCSFGLSVWIVPRRGSGWPISFTTWSDWSGSTPEPRLLESAETTNRTEPNSKPTTCDRKSNLPYHALSTRYSGVSSWVLFWPSLLYGAAAVFFWSNSIALTFCANSRLVDHSQKHCIIGLLFICPPEVPSPNDVVKKLSSQSKLISTAYWCRHRYAIDTRSM